MVSRCLKFLKCFRSAALSSAGRSYRILNIDWYAANNGELKTLPENLGNTQGNAIFMKPGDFTLWLYLDTVVGELVAGSRYNDYTDVYKKWFGRNPPPQRFYAAAPK